MKPIQCAFQAILISICVPHIFAMVACTSMQLASVNDSAVLFTAYSATAIVLMVFVVIWLLRKSCNKFWMLSRSNRWQFIALLYLAASNSMGILPSPMGLESMMSARDAAIAADAIALTLLMTVVGALWASMEGRAVGQHKPEDCSK